MCSGRVRSENSTRVSVVGAEKEKGKRWWWSVFVCSRVRCDMSGRCASTGKGSGQARSASVSGVVGSARWCTHSEMCVCVRGSCLVRKLGVWGGNAATICAA